ncbi:MAG: ABATE domain-containing protein [Gemmatimonadota bacterium]|nr:ABATE domain-containing protein [Gemmatimonadota bacterium]
MNQDSHFVFDGGTLALDLLNTWRFNADQPLDLLQSPEDLVIWLAAAGLPDGAYCAELSSSPPNRRILLDETLWLRQDILLIVQSLVAGELPPPYTVDALNRILTENGTSFRLDSLTIPPEGDQGEGMEGQLVLNVHEHISSVLGVLQPIALSAARIVTEVNPTRIRQCASSNCMYWFLDTSKSGRRRWCSMSRCGNRAKVAKHYRQRSTPS